jgi:hypothetical protein
MRLQHLQPGRPSALLAAAVMALVSGAAPAQDAPPPGQPPATEPPASGAQAGPPSQPAAAPAAAPTAPAAREELPREASQRVVGREVTGPSGEVVGRIVNVLLDDNGQPRAAVLDYGGFLGVGRRRVAVAWRTLRFSPETVRLDFTRDQMRAFPDYKEGDTVVVAAPPEPPPASSTATPPAPEPAQPSAGPGAAPAQAD